MEPNETTGVLMSFDSVVTVTVTVTVYLNMASNKTAAIFLSTLTQC